MRRYTEAEAAYRQAIQLEPTDAGAHKRLGRLLELNRQYGEAEAAYRQAIRFAPHDADAHNSLGHILLETDRFGEAEATFREAVRLDPSSADSCQGLALAQKYGGSQPGPPRQSMGTRLARGWAAFRDGT